MDQVVTICQSTGVQYLIAESFAKNTNYLLTVCSPRHHSVGIQMYTC